MQSICIIKRWGAAESIWLVTLGGRAERMSASKRGSSGTGERPKPLGELQSRLGRPADDQYGVLASDGADDLGPILRVDRLGDWLRPAGQGVQHKQLADT